MNDFSASDEFAWIARQTRALKVRDGVRVGVGDDAAVLETLHAPVVTCDCLVENVHFRRDWTSPRALGRKSISVSVSDVAAMGARPVAAFVSVAIPASIELGFWDEFYRGLEEIAAHFGFTVAGGDTSRSSSQLFINVALVGECEENTPPVLRSGAQVGDVLMVTGSLGDAGAGLWLLQNPQIEMEGAAREFLLQRHFDPTARLREMQSALSCGGVRAALDLSDGLAGDAAHMARASGVSLQIETGQLPISRSCRVAAQRVAAQIASSDDNRVLDVARNWALGGGEDYELLLSVAPERANETVRCIEQKTKTRATVIGRCIASENGENRVILLDNENREIASPRAWTHF